MGVWQRLRGVFWEEPKPTPTRSRRSFAAAAVNRLTSSWMTSLRSANQELETALTTLRGRSRQLCRDNPHAASFLSLLKINVSGPTGIGFQAQLLNTRGELHKGFNREVELAWARWCRVGSATADGRMSWAEFLQLGDALEAQDGEVLIRLIDDPSNKYGFAVEYIDPDRLDETLNQKIQDKPEIRMGVELGDYGRPVAYWIRPRHPNEPSGRTEANKPVRVPASEIIHRFMAYRPSQVRGIPWLTPVAVRLRMLDKWEEAAITAAAVGASKMGFFVDTRDEAGEGYETPADLGEGDAGTMKMDVEPGVFGQLPPGMDFKPFDPDYPNIAFEQFERAMLRSIAAGLGVSYTSLASDLTAVNYSSIRAGLLTERDVYRMLQHRVIEHTCRRVFRRWIESATLTDSLRPPVNDFDAIGESIVWTPRGWAWVDPKSDVQAAKEMIALGLASRTGIANALGGDFQDNLELLALEQELAEAVDVPIMGLTSQGDQVGATDGTTDGTSGGDGAGDDASDDASGKTEAVRLVRRLG